MGVALYEIVYRYQLEPVITDIKENYPIDGVEEAFAKHCLQLMILLIN